MAIPSLVDIVRNAVSAFAGGADPWTVLKLGSNAAISTTAFGNVSGMSFTANANTWYEVECYGAYQSAATTTGMALALDIPSGTVQGTTITHSTAVAVVGAQQIADATTTGATAGVATANTDTPVFAKFMIQVGGTGGTVQLMMRSEVASSAVTLQANKFAMKYRALP